MKFTDYKLKKEYNKYRKTNKDYYSPKLFDFFYSNNRFKPRPYKCFKPIKVKKIIKYYKNQYKLVFYPNTSIFILFKGNKISNKDIDIFTVNNKSLTTVYY